MSSGYFATYMKQALVTGAETGPIELNKDVARRQVLFLYNRDGLYRSLSVMAFTNFDGCILFLREVTHGHDVGRQSECYCLMKVVIRAYTCTGNDIASNTTSLTPQVGSMLH